MNSIKMYIQQKEKHLGDDFSTQRQSKKAMNVEKSQKTRRGQGFFYISWEFAFTKRGVRWKILLCFLFFFIVFVSVYYGFSASC